MLQQCILHDELEELEVLCDIATRVGTTITIVSDKTSEGSQFVKGFGGYGGIARYAINNQDEYEGEGEEVDMWMSSSDDEQ